MDDSSTSSSGDRELRELRERAYGPHSDIDDDPAAIARLAELEAARAPLVFPGRSADVASAGSIDPTAASVLTTSSPPAEAVPAPAAASVGDTARSLWRRATATRAGRIWMVAGALAALSALLYAVVWDVMPHPDATLRPTSDEPGPDINAQLDWVRELEIDPAKLRGFDAYRGIEIWATEDLHQPCLIAIEPSIGQVVGAECTAVEAELLTDVLTRVDGQYGEDLPAGSVIRFHLHGDTVDVYLFPAEARDH